MKQRSAQLLQALCDRWRVPNEVRQLADVVAREHGNIHRSMELNAAALLRLLERCDAIRKPARFADVLLACECDARRPAGQGRFAVPAAHAAAGGIAGGAVGLHTTNSRRGAGCRVKWSESRRADSSSARRGDRKRAPRLKPTA